MTKRVVWLIPLLLVGCTDWNINFNPYPVLRNGLPVPPGDILAPSNNAAAATTQQPPKAIDASDPNLFYTLFLASYRRAAQDDWLISSGQAKNGAAYYAQVPSMYDDPSPLDYAICPSGAPAAPTGTSTPGQLAYRDPQIPPVCQPTAAAASAKIAAAATAAAAAAKAQADAAATNAKNAQTIAASAQAAASAAAKGKTPPATPAPAPVSQPAATSTQPASDSAPVLTPGQVIPGSSNQSIHARQMALDGVHLADLRCHQFFVQKGLLQSRLSLANDISGSAGSLAGAVAGIFTGIAAAPASVGLLTGTTSTLSGVAKQEFLYGSDDIASVYKLVTTAQASDIVHTLPDPDYSNWTFQQAVTVIEQHQDICRPDSILDLIKGQISSSTVTTTSAACPSGQTQQRVATRKSVQTSGTPSAQPATSGGCSTTVSGGTASSTSPSQ